MNNSETKIKKQIAVYTDRLKNLKDNLSKEIDSLSEKETESYGEQIRMTAEFIRVLKQLENQPK